MKIRTAKKVLNYSRRDGLADLPEIIQGYCRRTRMEASRRYEKWIKNKKK